MVHLPYTLTGPIGRQASLGLIVLQADETIEHDFRRMFRSENIALYVTRIPSGADVTPDMLATMEAVLPVAAGLLPPSIEFDAIGYACTSGAMQIGPERVSALVRGAARVRHVTQPFTATVEALTCLGAKGIGLVTPYIDAVSGPLAAAIEAHGFPVRAVASFEEQVDARVARIDPASVRDAVMEVGRGDDVDAVFVSCTNLRTLDIIAALEQQLEKPVVSSNQALAWHMARLSETERLVAGPGRLMQIDDAGSRATAR